MWWTPQGERALKGAEWELFREGLDMSWDWVEESMDDPDLFTFDVEAFDRLQPVQRLALLELVGTALRDESSPHPALTAHNEASVAAIFSNITTQVAMEIDLAPEDGTFEERTSTRRLVLAAYHEVAAQEAASRQKEADETEDSRSPVSPPTTGEEEESDTEVWSPPAADSVDMEEWTFVIDHMANQILWEDGDFEMGDDFMDADPVESRLRKEMMGIADDYYTAIAPDPTDKDLEAIREQLRKLTGRKKPR
jgi:hypothetical protein